MDKIDEHLESWFTVIGFIKGSEKGEQMVRAIDVINKHFGIEE